MAMFRYEIPEPILEMFFQFMLFFFGSLGQQFCNHTGRFFAIHLQGRQLGANHVVSQFWICRTSLVQTLELLEILLFALLVEAIGELPYNVIVTVDQLLVDDVVFNAF